MLYRGKYLIGIYSLISEGEQLLALVDNYQEFAKLMNIKPSNAAMILSNLFKHKTNKIIYQGKVRTVEFIEYIEEN